MDVAEVEDMAFDDFVERVAYIKVVNEPSRKSWGRHLRDHARQEPQQRDWRSVYFDFQKRKALQDLKLGKNNA